MMASFMRVPYALVFHVLAPQAYTLYYRHVHILVFLHVFVYSLLLRCMFKV